MVRPKCRDICAYSYGMLSIEYERCAGMKTLIGILIGILVLDGFIRLFEHHPVIAGIIVVVVICVICGGGGGGGGGDPFDWCTGGGCL